MANEKTPSLLSDLLRRYDLSDITGPPVLSEKVGKMLLEQEDTGVSQGEISSRGDVSAPKIEQH